MNTFALFMKLPKIPLAQTVIKLCELKEIKNIVISPGSRSAPLTLGFTNHPFFNCYSIVDERSAGFFALGIAQQLNEPVAVVCTSGSALLNYFPAIAEAYYSDIPLVILSADRPKYLIGIGDGQTIDQKNVYGVHSLYTTSLKEDIDPNKKSDDDEPMIIRNIENKLEKFLKIQSSIQDQNVAEINTALNIAIQKKGPVHINIPLNEPLYETTKDFSVYPKSEIASEIDATIDLKLVQELSDSWNNASKKMILIGVNGPNVIENQWLEGFAEDDSVMVFTETTSNLYHPEFFPSIDKIIAPLTTEEFEDLQPEILLTFGGVIVSKKIKAFLRKYKPQHHWHIDDKKALDTFFSLNKHLNYRANTFLSHFVPNVVSVKSNYKPYWKSIKENRRNKHKNYLDSIEFSDLMVFDRVLRSIPDHSILQVGNSSAIRYTQLFDLNPTLKVFCNRGTSGIDGCTSTAIGGAIVSEERTIFITGDLSFFYDSNALWNKYIPQNFRIILINNGGGGIFRILPGEKNTENFDTYFETTHEMSAEHLCKMYKFEHISVCNDDELKVALNGFYKDSDVPKLLEIHTPRTDNDNILLNYFNYIK